MQLTTMDETICYSFEDFLSVFNQYAKTNEQERKKKLLEERDYYHSANGFPDWFNESLESFKEQVIDMASPTKPLKTTETFKVQAGYPHEVSRERKQALRDFGIKEDRNVKRDVFLIPKIDAQGFYEVAKADKVVSYSTPKDSNFIREIVVVDTETNSDLFLFYVLGRKAKVLSSWSVKRENNQQFIPEINKNEEWKYRQP